MHITQFGRLVLFSGFLALAAGCTSVRAPSDADPFEGFNRGVDSFNQTVDKVALKPVAQGYDKYVPGAVKSCVGNFFSNLNDISIAVNNLLQGKFKEAGSDICRFAINTTVGVLGLTDPASGMGFQKHDEDFGQTLGYWGVGSGPYLVLPLLGPSTIRDTAGRVVDNPMDPLAQHTPVDERNSAIAVKAVDKRAELLPATNLVDRVALDKYSFVRDAYLASRASKIRDGKPAPEDEELKPDESDKKPAESSDAQAQPASLSFAVK